MSRFNAWSCRSGLLIVVLAIVWPVAAQAQDISDVRSRFHVDVGDIVWVTTTAGTMTRGRVAHVDADSLELWTNNQRLVVAGPDVRRIEMLPHNPPVNYTLRGLVYGAGGGAALGILLSSSCEVHPCLVGGMRVLLTATAVGAGIGTGVGMLTDALVNRKRVVYELGRVALNVQPVLAPRVTGFVATVRW
jgi:hypothetical protein